MSIEQILRMNDEKEPKTLIMKKTVFTYAVCLRLVAALGRIFPGGMYWKVEKNDKEDDLFDIEVVGHTKEDICISPEFFNFILNMNFSHFGLDEGDNFVAYASREGMNEYAFGQFETEEKIAAYMEKNGIEEEEPRIVPVGDNGCVRPFMIVRFNY